MSHEQHAAGWDSTPPDLRSDLVSDGLKAAVAFSGMTREHGRLPEEYGDDTRWQNRVSLRFEEGEPLKWQLCHAQANGI